MLLKLGGIRAVSLLDANLIALGEEKGPELMQLDYQISSAHNQF